MAVVRGGPRDYRDHHPTGKDTVLVVEVADTTWRFDRERKGRVYAAARIPEYWILNLEHRSLEVYRRPEEGEYREQLILREEDSVAPLLRPEVQIASRISCPDRTFPSPRPAGPFGRSGV